MAILLPLPQELAFRGIARDERRGKTSAIRIFIRTAHYHEMCIRDSYETDEAPLSFDQPALLECLEALRTPLICQ